MDRRGKKLSTTLLRSVLAYTSVVLICFAAVFSGFFYVSTERNEEARVAAIAQDAASVLDGRSIQDDIRVLESQLQSDIRYTLIDTEGNVIFDSKGDAGANHADRPEVIEARRAGASSVTRYSSTLGEDTVYAAVLLGSENVLRLSEQRASFLAVFESAAPALGVALVAVLLLSVVLSRVLSRRIVAPFGQVDVAHPLESDSYDEMLPLLERIEHQRRQLMDQNNELARAEDMRREFSANVSHEMKTPLQVISGYAELLANGGIPEENTERFAALILTESENMTALIDDVLVLSRLDDPLLENAGKEDVELRALAHEVVTRLMPLASRRKVRMRCLGSSVMVNGNRGLLDQLVSNLVTNAVKYSEAGGEVIVSIGKNLAVPGSDGIAEAYVRVKDNGCGIPEEEVDKIFERFYRIDKSRSKESGGTGLGLAIAKHAAAFHNATISVESQPGKGSVFTVLIPTDQYDATSPSTRSMTQATA